MKIGLISSILTAFITCIQFVKSDEPLNTDKNKIKTTILKIEDVWITPYSNVEKATYHFTGMAVFVENRNETTRNTSIYMNLVPHEKKGIFPADYASIEFKGLNLSKSNTNFSQGVYYGGNINCTYRIIQKNKLTQFDRLSKLGGDFLADDYKGGNYSFWIGDDDQAEFPDIWIDLGPAAEMVSLQHHESNFNFSPLPFTTLTLISFPIGAVASVILMCVRDPRRIPAHSLLLVTAGFFLVVMIGWTVTGELGGIAGYSIGFLWSPIMFFTGFLALGKITTKAEVVTKENKFYVILLSMVYYVAAILVFPITQEYEPYISSWLWIVLIIENWTMSKNIISGLMVAILIGLQQLTWFYIYYYEGNSGLLLVNGKDAQVPGIIAIVLAVIAVASLFMAKNIKPDETWNALKWNDDNEMTSQKQSVVFGDAYTREHQRLRQEMSNPVNEEKSLE